MICVIFNQIFFILSEATSNVVCLFFLTNTNLPNGHEWIILILVSLELALQAFVALYAKDGQAAILACLGESEEYGPENTLHGGTDGQQHLGKGQDVEGYTTQQDDSSRSEREGLQPCLDSCNYFHFLFCIRSTSWRIEVAGVQPIARCSLRWTHFLTTSRSKKSRKKGQLGPAS